MEEILHQLIGSLSNYLQGFVHLRWLAGFLPSTVSSIQRFQKPFERTTTSNVKFHMPNKKYPPPKKTQHGWQWKIHHERRSKMYILLKHTDFPAGHVSFLFFFIFKWPPFSIAIVDEVMELVHQQHWCSEDTGLSCLPIWMPGVLFRWTT